MADLLDQGIEAFGGMRCPMGHPPDCVLVTMAARHQALASGDLGPLPPERVGVQGGEGREQGGYAPVSEIYCDTCGMTGRMDRGVVEGGSPFEYDETGQSVMTRMTMTKTGARRGRDQGLEELAVLCEKLGLGMNAFGMAKSYYYKSIDERLHLGGRGLRSVVAVAAFLAALTDNTPRRMEDVVLLQGVGTEVRVANRLLNEVRKRRLFPRVRPDAKSILERRFHSWPISARARDEAVRLVSIPLPINPSHHAAGAAYLSLQSSGGRRERRMSMREVADVFSISRKSVSLGARNLRMKLGIENPPKPKDGLTGEQVRLLRDIRRQNP